MKERKTDADGIEEKKKKKKVNENRQMASFSLEYATLLLAFVSLSRSLRKWRDWNKRRQEQIRSQTI